MPEKKNVINNSTIARIAGNMLSGQRIPEGDYADLRKALACNAVAMARAIAAEVQRTTPEQE